MGHWQEIDHTADAALRLWGSDLADLFATAAHGMFAMIGVPDRDGRSVEVSVQLGAPDAETLLVDWLNELLYLSEKHRVIFTEFEFGALSASSLSASVRGYPLAEVRRYIKAVTFHNLQIKVTSEGLTTEIVFDL